MKSKYDKWILLGVFLAAVTIISIWGMWGAIAVAFIVFFIFSRYCLITWWYIYRKKPKKKNKKYPKKMRYVDWSFVNGKPVAKDIVEKELKESQ
jgi:hypothetical protein